VPVSVFFLVFEKKLTYKYQGRHFRLTDVHGNLVDKMLA
jgi:hypothetical protein